jgi:hypothetical protein
MVMAPFTRSGDDGSAQSSVWFASAAVRLLCADRGGVLPSAVMCAAFTCDCDAVSAQCAVQGSRTTHGHGQSDHIDKGEWLFRTDGSATTTHM